MLSTTLLFNKFITNLKFNNVYKNTILINKIQLFSSITEATIINPPKIRKRRELPAPITLTESAADRIRALLNSNSKAIGLKIGVRRRGCNGLSYTINYSEEKPINVEEVFEKNVRIFIETPALLHIVGTTMDYQEDDISSQFKFINPNEKGRCGCGESFNV